MTISGQIDRRGLTNRYELRNRYIFTGQLEMKTALHIGGGKITLTSSDSPVVLTPEQQPFIPGSSFKGTLRSTIEKIVPNLPGFSSCALRELSEKELKEAHERGEKVCPTVQQHEIAQSRRNPPEGKTTEDILEEAIGDLCDTCLLFGSPFTAARLNVSDLYMPDEEWSGMIQVRDGVAIDRDTEKARDRFKYDFEVVPASATFKLNILLENATKRDIQLLCVGLSEFVHGFGVVGGKRSRGLGVAQLENLRVSALELFEEGVKQREVSMEQRRQRMRDYLLRKTFSDQVDGPTFIAKYIEDIFA
ncbi:MAG: type III CRISPR-associated RAMP protein Csx7 [Ktedonobacteraceae bacterium]